MKKQGEKQFVQAVFCAPTGAYEDKPYPSRLTDEVFGALAEAGINRIFAFGYDSRRETIEKTFELCEKYGIMYYPTPKTSEEYVRILPGEHGEKPFSELTPEEIVELDRNFVAEIELMTHKKAFGGIFFSDEAGYLSFDGIAHAKKVFDEYYGGYEFHTNFYSYSINDAIFWGGMGGLAPEKLPFRLEGNMEICFKNRFTFYDTLVEGLLSKASFEFVSQDKYPFENFWPTVPTSVHVALFELNDYFNVKKRKYGNKFYNYMQVGQWFGKDRQMRFAEMALQMHVTAAYGSEGFAYFPGCFPLDYTGQECYAFAENGGSALIDMQGKKTIFYEWVKKLNGFFKQIEDDILSSEHKGVRAYGTYKNGFTQEEISDLTDSECIFCGELPKTLQIEMDVQIDCDNEVMVSEFERNGEKRYYLVNLSTAYDCKVEMTLPGKQYQIYGLETVKVFENQVTLQIPAGEGVYIIEQK